MNKHLIIKFIEKRTSAQEEEQVLKWINKYKENEDYYIALKNLYVSQNLSNRKANVSEINEIINKTVLKSGTESKMKNTLSFYRWSSIVAGVLLLISLGINILGPDKLLRLGSEKGNIAEKGDTLQTGKIVALSTLPKDMKMYYYTVKGAKARLELPDGSVAWLNSDSKITYPYKFEGPTREVEISGEALFEVVKNPKIPMVVSTNKGFKIKVYGTIFNIRSYDDDIKAFTTLYEGKIELITNNSGKEAVIPILPNQVYEVSGRKLLKAALIKCDNPKNQSAWQDGKMVFDNTPFSDVLKTLERWHGTVFEIKDSEILNYTITATFRSESIVQIMEALRYCSLIDYKLNGNKVILTSRKK